MSYASGDGLDDNNYVINTESAAEMARLMRQDHLLTEGMGGLFPEGIELSPGQRVLDMACGPGGWVMEVAFAHTDVEVIGVDISRTMVSYAQTQARIQGLTNASFRVMNILRPLDFPDQSFDLINARLIVTFMKPSQWPSLLRECLRLLKPGGALRFTDMEGGFSNKPAYEKICGLFCQALTVSGQSFSPNGMHFGLIPMLRRLLQDAGCSSLNKKAHVIEFSYDTDAHDSYFYNISSVIKLVQPFIIQSGVVAASEWDRLYAQCLLDMQAPDFCGIWILLTVWGFKPASGLSFLDAIENNS